MGRRGGAAVGGPCPLDPRPSGSGSCACYETARGLPGGVSRLSAAGGGVVHHHFPHLLLLLLLLPWGGSGGTHWGAGPLAAASVHSPPGADLPHADSAADGHRSGMGSVLNEISAAASVEKDSAAGLAAAAAAVVVAVAAVV